jgi:hypothetical protein
MRNINLQNILRKKPKLTDGESSMAWPVHFIRDWKIVVCIFAAGLVSLTIFSWQIYLSDKIAGGYLAPNIETSDSITKTIDEKRLQTDIIILETKQTDYLKLKEARVKLTDPSL